MYGSPWCHDCRRSKKLLGEHRVQYDWIDVDEDASGLRFVEELQGGGRTILELLGEGGKLREVRARDRTTGEEHAWHPAGIFVFIGFDANSAFLKGTLDRDEWGFIIAPRCETSLAGVFAAGDVRAGSTKQLGAATGDGITALIAIRDFLQQHHRLKAVPVNA